MSPAIQHAAPGPPGRIAHPAKRTRASAPLGAVSGGPPGRQRVPQVAADADAQMLWALLALKASTASTASAISSFLWRHCDPLPPRAGSPWKPLGCPHTDYVVDPNRASRQPPTSTGPNQGRRRPSTSLAHSAHPTPPPAGCGGLSRVGNTEKPLWVDSLIRHGLWWMLCGGWSGSHSYYSQGWSRCRKNSVTNHERRVRQRI